MVETYYNSTRGLETLAGAGGSEGNEDNENDRENDREEQEEEDSNKGDEDAEDDEIFDDDKKIKRDSNGDTPRRSKLHGRRPCKAVWDQIECTQASNGKWIQVCKNCNYCLNSKARQAKRLALHLVQDCEGVSEKVRAEIWKESNSKEVKEAGKKRYLSPDQQDESSDDEVSSDDESEKGGVGSALNRVFQRIVSVATDNVNDYDFALKKLEKLQRILVKRQEGRARRKSNKRQRISSAKKLEKLAEVEV